MALQYMTQEGLDKLKKELAEAIAQRPVISAAIAEARDKGDLSENAEYEAAREAQGLLELNISKLQNLVANARVIDESQIGTDKVQMLNKVKVKNLNTKASSGHSDIILDKVPASSNIECSSGGIDVSIPEDSDVTVHAHLSSGELNYDLPFTKDGKDYINGNGTADMSIHCSSGDVTFHKV